MQPQVGSPAFGASNYGRRRFLLLEGPDVRSYYFYGRCPRYAHHQCALWLAALTSGPRSIDCSSRLTLELAPECILGLYGRERVSNRQGVRADRPERGCHPVLRKQGLLERLPRSEGGYRLFTSRDVRRIQFVRRAQGLGFSLPEIRELLVLQGNQAEACCHVRDLLRVKLSAVRGKLRQLGSLQLQLTKSLRECERRLKAGEASHPGPCPLLEAMEQRGPDEN